MFVFLAVSDEDKQIVLIPSFHFTSIQMWQMLKCIKKFFSYINEPFRHRGAYKYTPCMLMFTHICLHTFVVRFYRAVYWLLFTFVFACAKS